MAGYWQTSWGDAKLSHSFEVQELRPMMKSRPRTIVFPIGTKILTVGLEVNALASHNHHNEYMLDNMSLEDDRISSRRCHPPVPFRS